MSIHLKREVNLCFAFGGLETFCKTSDDDGEVESFSAGGGRGRLCWNSWPDLLFQRCAAAAQPLYGAARFKLVVHGKLTPSRGVSQSRELRCDLHCHFCYLG